MSRAIAPRRIGRFGLLGVVLGAAFLAAPSDALATSCGSASFSNVGPVPPSTEVFVDRQASGITDYKVEISWGDAGATSTGGSGHYTHTYDNPGIFHVTVKQSGQFDSDGDGTADTQCSDQGDFDVTVDPVTVIGNATVTEPASGSTAAVFQVILSNASDRSASVSYSTAAGSAGSADFTPTSGTVTFAPGETSKTISVPVLGDDVAEGDETFTVNLSGWQNAIGGAALGDASLDHGTGTIHDNPPTGPGSSDCRGPTDPTHPCIKTGITISKGGSEQSVKLQERIDELIAQRDAAQREKDYEINAGTVVCVLLGTPLGPLATIAAGVGCWVLADQATADDSERIRQLNCLIDATQQFKDAVDRLPQRKKATVTAAADTSCSEHHGQRVLAAAAASKRKAAKPLRAYFANARAVTKRILDGRAALLKARAAIVKGKLRTAKEQIKAAGKAFTAAGKLLKKAPGLLRRARTAARKVFKKAGITAEQLAQTQSDIQQGNIPENVREAARRAGLSDSQFAALLASAGTARLRGGTVDPAVLLIGGANAAADARKVTRELSLLKQEAARVGAALRKK